MRLRFRVGARVISAGLVLAACGNGTVKTQGSGTSTGATSPAASSSASRGSTRGSGSSSRSGASSKGSSGGSGSSGSSGGGSRGGSSSGGPPSCVDGGFNCASLSQVCDTVTGACVGCLTNADCASSIAGTLCNTTTHSCAQCLAATDCPYSTPGCSGGACGGCNVDGDCLPSQSCTEGVCTCTSDAGCGGNAPVCIVNQGSDAGVCGCEESSDCPSSEICDTTSFVLNGVCISSCATQPDVCAPGSLAPDCDVDSGVCVPCLTDAECVDAGLGTVCSPGLGCISCQSNSDCTSKGTPYCVDGTCEQCITAQDCPASSPGCDSASFTCGSCTFDSDCPDGGGCAYPMCAPFCTTAASPDAGCAACSSNADCSGGSCNDAGVCG